MWKDKSGKLYRKYEFKTFVEAFSFMTAVALLVEKADHHQHGKTPTTKWRFG